ncbi:MAG: DUF418 domain-containing protein [Sphingomicrobium sp.]
MDNRQDKAIDRVRGIDRIAALDVVRGIAILFILFMNIPAMGGYEFELHDPRIPTWTQFDAAAYWTQSTLLNGTQRGLLELLFGAGIMIMARRAMTGDGPVEVADLHYRRNLWLCVFGLANAFVLMWFGDILLVYGLAAIFLFPFRKLTARVQIGFAALLIGSLVVFSALDYRETQARYATVARVSAAHAAHHKVSAEDQKVVDKFAERAAALRDPLHDKENVKKIRESYAAHHGSFAQYWQAQANDWLILMSYFWYIEAEILGTMLIGMAFYQWGIIQGQARSSIYWAMVILGYGIGIASRGTFYRDLMQFVPALHWQNITADVDRLAVTFGHLGLIHLALRSRAGRFLLKPFEAAGRMPLTVYLFTSLLMMWVIFAPWGFAMFGQWGFAQMVAVAAVTIAAEVAVANIWMARFDNGPMEWIWKSLAYQRREPFRKVAPAVIAVPPGMVPAE